MLLKMGGFLGVLLLFGSLLSGCGTMSKADQQKNLQSFVAQVDKDQQSVANAELNLTVAVSQFKGSDTSNISTSVTQLQNASDSAESNFSDLSTPSGFSDDVNTLLSDAVNNYVLAYHAEYEGGDSLTHYLDSQNPNDLQTYKDKMATAKERKDQATTDIQQAKQKVGIK